jgi:hypothetical protein
MPEEQIQSFTQLVSKTVSRLARIWQEGEGDMMIEIRDDKGKKTAKIKGGETERF